PSAACVSPEGASRTNACGCSLTTTPAHGATAPAPASGSGSTASPGPTMLSAKTGSGTSRIATTRPATGEVTISASAIPPSCQTLGRAAGDPPRRRTRPRGGSSWRALACNVPSALDDEPVGSVRMTSERLTGVPASPGRAAGVVVRMPARVPEPRTSRLTGDAEAAVRAVEEAAAQVEADLAERARRASGTAADVLAVTAAMAADPTLAAGAARRVREDRLTPERAVWDAAGSVASQLESLGPPMSERARDVRDVRDRIVAALTGAAPPGVPDPG